ncbi:hypothetical protein DESC_290155 [Desulfosarcina cetonica]|nr:hypothetical protein DESC_290155 [Desulfosarcina cetonica]
MLFFYPMKARAANVDTRIVLPSVAGGITPRLFSDPKGKTL